MKPLGFNVQGESQLLFPGAERGKRTGTLPAPIYGRWISAGGTMTTLFATINPLFEAALKLEHPKNKRQSDHPDGTFPLLLGRWKRISGMKTTFKIPILHRLGIHLRAGAQLVRVTSRFKSKILVSNGGYPVNAKSLIDLLTIGAIYGSVLEFSAEGEDASQAVEAIRKLLNEWKEKDGDI
jgi:phosphotransferase system HPr (HPr) family protein